MEGSTYDRETWRGMDAATLAAHARDSAKLAARHHADGDEEALAATVAVLEQQVGVLAEKLEAPATMAPEPEPEQDDGHPALTE